jgi:histidine kinase
MPVLADPDRIGQVLTNLLGNALQYTPAGGRVEISVRRAPEGVELAVTDTGAGIAPAHLPHIFDRFYRADRSRARASGGSGIGLTIARSLVEAHHGRIRAASEGEGRGSTFSFTLPAA